MKAAELFVKCLEAEGVKYIFGVPGEENLDFLEAVRTSSIKFVVTRHEQAAVFMAATMGRLTGKAGVALSTLGPGATNLVTGVAYAQLGAMPLLVITGQKPIRKSKQGKFQIIDVVSMMRPITKFTASITSADQVPALVREAFKIAEAERPGATHLELPEDIAAEETSLVSIEPESITHLPADAKTIEQAAQMISTAKHPIVLVAAGANRKRVRKELKEFLDKTQIPFVTTQMGKGVENESSELYLGTTALSDNDYVHCALNYADVIISVGHDTVEKPPVIMTRQHHQVIHVNFSASIKDDVYVPSLELVGDIAGSLSVLTERIKPGNWDFSYFFRLRTHMQQQLQEKTDSDSFPIKPQRIVNDLRQSLPPDGILSLDNGMYKLWIARNYPAYEQNSVLLDNALATMGAGVPAGIAAKMLSPGKKVLVVAGDGGVMMNISELETAQRLGLDLVVLILNDSGYGMIKWKQADMGFANFGLEFTNPDFVKLAESFGAVGHRIAAAHELKPVLEKALAAKGVHIIDCPIDYSENKIVFGEELKNKTCNI